MELTLISELDIPQDILTKRAYKNGVSEMVIHSQGNNLSQLRFTSTASGICMIFNYGDVISVGPRKKQFRIPTKQQNIFNLKAGSLDLWLKDDKNFLIHLIVIPSELFEHILRHLEPEPEKLKLCREPFMMLFSQNLHIGDEIHHNLHAFHVESILPESIRVYIYARLLIFLSLQFSQHVMLNTAKNEEIKNTESLTMTAKMHRVEQIIRSDLTGRHTLHDLAKLIGTNECYLKKDFKDIFGMPVRAYQRKIKMEKANTLLLNTSKSIEVISAQLGYKHITHFTAAYKKYYQMTPGETRRGSKLSEY